MIRTIITAAIAAIITFVGLSSSHALDVEETFAYQMGYHYGAGLCFRHKCNSTAIEISKEMVKLIKKVPIEFSTGEERSAFSFGYTRGAIDATMARKD